ncbi:M20 metallopeptidase family protein [Nocardia arthritidis]|uniref:Amidohydrolase n=1 Tax=Nocardia arthritidis TaxID=228602 RepID=A0A6G9YEB9_9NOCA|nr:M20 family metallopeptidase [Nocardia arthritidis]QIS11542.1 amidohydrolase [Nocardia arthritidis]
MALRDDASALSPDLVRLRRDLHRIPEVGLDLPRTQERVLTALADLPLEISTGSALTSVTAVLRGRPGGPAVLLRGDMDALPLTERADVSYASQTGDTMHACGHDLHVAMLVGAAHLLAARRETLCGDVVFMFQPGEEGWDGAGAMLSEGVLDGAGRRVSAAYGLHVSAASFPRGVFASRTGPMLSASDRLTVTVRGAGGHGSAPYRAKDPVPAMAEMITALQTIVTRQFDVFDPVVLTIGLVQAGTKRNIIPDTAFFEATVRSFTRTAQARITDAAVAVVRGIAAAHGLEVDVEYANEYPVTATDSAETDFLTETVAEVFGPERFQPMANPLTASEDFSRVLDAVPGSFAMLGAAPEGTDPQTAPSNHSPYAIFDDAVLPDGATLLAELAIRRLEREAAHANQS